MKSVRDEISEVDRREVSLFLEELDEIIGSIKEAVSIDLDKKEYRIDIESIEGEENKEYLNEAVGIRRPNTRSKGKVKEHEWVMDRALEHKEKGRPRIVSV